MVPKLVNAKEFIYELGERYYIIGRATCVEIFDTKLISLYEDFVGKTNFLEFDTIQRNIQKWQVQINKIKEIGISYQRICNACMTEKLTWSSNEFFLLIKLEEEYSREIDRQIDRRNKASLCLDFIDAESIL